MKKIILILSLILFFQFTLNAQERELKAAENFYKQNKYEQAANIYKSLLDSGYNDSKIYYNLGNTYYRMGKIGYSILYYEKASKLDPNDKDIQHNLMFANSKKPVKEDRLPDFFLTEIIDSISGYISFTGWFILTNVLYLALLAGIGFYFLSGIIRIQRLSFFASMAVLLLLLFSSGMLYAKYRAINSNDSAVLIVQTAELKSAPDIESKNLISIFEGIKLTKIEEMEDWVKVKLPDGKSGWVNKNLIETI